MTREEVAAWLDAYVAAWQRYDEAAIEALFTEEAEYRYHPWEEPLRGRTAIAAHWLEHRDEPGTWQAQYEPWAVDSDRAVAVGRTHYDENGGQKTYHNVFLCSFDGDGRCREFTEVYLLER